MSEQRSLIGSYRFNSGVLSSENLARDLAIYANALEVAENVDLLPYGAARQRAALRQHLVLENPNNLASRHRRQARRIIPFEVEEGEGEFLIYLYPERAGDISAVLWRAYKYDPITGEINRVAPDIPGSISGMHSGELASARYAQSHNTLLLFHSRNIPTRFRWSQEQETMMEDLAPLRIPTTPVYPGDAISAGDTLGVNAVQDIRIPFFDFDDFSFQLRLNGEQTGLIRIPQGAKDNAAARNQGTANLEAALGPLLAAAFPNASGEGSRFSVVVTVSEPLREITYSVRFAGPLGNQPIPRMQMINRSGGTIIATVSHRNVGEYPRTPAWSSERGYPTCGTFYGGRLFAASTPTDRQRIWASRANDFFNFDSSPDEQLVSRASDPGADVVTAGDALTIDLNTGEYNEVRHLFGKEHLLVFTSGETWFVDRDTLRPSPPPVAAQAKGYGASYAGPRLVGDAVYYISPDGALRDTIYEIAQQNYASSSLSRRAFHLIDDPQRIGGYTGTRNDDVNQMFVLNHDGTLAVLNFAAENQHYAWSHYTFNSGGEGSAHNRIIDFCVLNRKFVGVALTNEGSDLVLCSLDGSTKPDGTRLFTKDFQTREGFHDPVDTPDTGGDTAFIARIRTPQLFRSVSYNGGELWASNILGGYILVPYDKPPRGLQVRLSTFKPDTWEDVPTRTSEWIRIPDLQSGPDTGVKLEMRTASDQGEMLVMGYRLEFQIQNQIQRGA